MREHGPSIASLRIWNSAGKSPRHLKFFYLIYPKWGQSKSGKLSNERALAGVNLCGSPSMLINVIGMRSDGDADDMRQRQLPH
jgi:hypothetical protein